MTVFLESTGQVHRVTPPLTARCLQSLADQAESANRSLHWPSTSWQALESAGVLRWAIPTEYGGSGLGAVEQFLGSEELAACCLTTAFILSQRETAVRQLLKAPLPLRQRFLPRMAGGQCFATVGVSQLTTSRQHGAPALSATPCQGGLRLSGEIPWVTGADQAEILVIGATLPDMLQVLMVLPTDRPGVSIEPPMSLTALAGSRTSAVRCSDVFIEHDLVIAGPSERVLGPVGGGGLETSNLAIGLARAAIDDLENEARRRDELQSLANPFRSRLDSLRAKLHALSAASEPAETHALRLDCTRLALQCTQAALLAAKGAGFVSPHPAQRRAHQAQFFLVWSCPRPIAAGLLDDLLQIALAANKP